MQCTNVEWRKHYKIAAMPRRLAHTLPTKADEGSGVGCVWVIVDRISKSGGGVAAVNAYNAQVQAAANTDDEIQIIRVKELDNENSLGIFNENV